MKQQRRSRHSHLDGRLRNHLQERGLQDKLFDMINRQLDQQGILVRTGSSVDATLNRETIWDMCIFP